MADCSTCKGGHTTKPESVPYLVYESAQARNERTVKRLIIAIVCVVIAFFVTNAAWLYVFQSYDYETYTVDLATDGGGDANYIGQDGDIYNNGTSESSTQDTPEEIRQ